MSNQNIPSQESSSIHEEEDTSHHTECLEQEAISSGEQEHEPDEVMDADTPNASTAEHDTIIDAQALQETVASEALIDMPEQDETVKGEVSNKTVPADDMTSSEEQHATQPSAGTAAQEDELQASDKAPGSSIEGGEALRETGAAEPEEPAPLSSGEVEKQDATQPLEEQERSSLQGDIPGTTDPSDQSNQTKTTEQESDSILSAPSNQPSEPFPLSLFPAQDTLDSTTQQLPTKRKRGRKKMTEEERELRKKMSHKKYDAKRKTQKARLQIDMTVHNRLMEMQIRLKVDSISDVLFILLESFEVYLSTMNEPPRSYEEPPQSFTSVPPPVPTPSEDAQAWATSEELTRSLNFEEQSQSVTSQEPQTTSITPIEQTLQEPQGEPKEPTQSLTSEALLAPSSATPMEQALISIKQEYGVEPMTSGGEGFSAMAESSDEPPAKKTRQFTEEEREKRKQTSREFRERQKASDPEWTQKETSRAKQYYIPKDQRSPEEWDAFKEAKREGMRRHRERKKSKSPGASVDGDSEDSKNKALSSAERAKRYRDRLKNDPSRLERHQQQERDRRRVSYVPIADSPEKAQRHQREIWKTSSKKSRQNKALESYEPPAPSDDQPGIPPLAMSPVPPLDMSPVPPLGPDQVKCESYEPPLPPIQQPIQQPAISHLDMTPVLPQDLFPVPPLDLFPVPPLDESPVQPLSGTERSKRYRDRLKNDPTRLERHQQQERERHRVKYVPIADRPGKAQRHQRQKWRTSSEKLRQNKALECYEPQGPSDYQPGISSLDMSPVLPQDMSLVPPLRRDQVKCESYEPPTSSDDQPVIPPLDVSPVSPLGLDNVKCENNWYSTAL